MIFLSEYQTHLSTSLSDSSIILEKVYIVKMCPNFDGSASTFVTRYQKILSVSSLGGKKSIESQLTH